MAGGQETHSHKKTKETHVGKSQENDDSKKTNMVNKQADQTGEDREKEAYSVKEKPYASIEEGEKVKEKEANQGEPETRHYRNEAQEKSMEAKDGVMSSYVGEKAVEDKDKAINVGKDAVSYAGEKAIEAKNASLEAGKGALDVGSKVVSSEANDDMLLLVDRLKKERDFYLAKLKVCDSEMQRTLEEQAMISQQKQQQQQNDQLAAENKRKSENQKRKYIWSEEVYRCCCQYKDI